MQHKIDQAQDSPASRTPPISRLLQWPCQLSLIPDNAPYLDGADLLIAADCTAYAYAGFHQDFMRGRITLIGCPRLDRADFTHRLGAILAQNDVQSILVIRMEEPCCNGMEQAVRQAVKASGKHVPLQILNVTTDGKMME